MPLQTPEYLRFVAGQMQDPEEQPFSDQDLEALLKMGTLEDKAGLAQRRLQQADMLRQMGMQEPRRGRANLSGGQSIEYGGPGWAQIAAPILGQLGGGLVERKGRRELEDIMRQQDELRTRYGRAAMGRPSFPREQAGGGLIDAARTGGAAPSSGLWDRIRGFFR